MMGKQMKTITVTMTILWLALPAYAGTDCTTRKSGSTTITTCSDTRNNSFTQCRSYKSGSVTKTSCR